MDLILRIDAKLEDIKYDKNLTLIEILDLYLSEYSFDSIFNLIETDLCKLNYYGCQNDSHLYYKFLIDRTCQIANNRFKNNYNGKIITLLTRTNIVLIINYIFLKKENLGTKEIKSRDLYELLLIINDFEQQNSPDLKTITSTLKTINDTDILKISASLIKSNGIINISHLRFPNIDRSSKMIEALLKEPEGIKCNNIFIAQHGYDIKEFFRICWATYLFLYENYCKNDFSNIIDFNTTFNRLITKDDPQQKLKSCFIKVFDKMCSSATTASINDITLYNTNYLWKNNIQKIGNEKYRIIDIGLFITSVFTNIFLTFEDPYLSTLASTNLKSNPLRSLALGTCFEKYCSDLTMNFEHRKVLNNYYKLQKGQTKRNEIADILFRIGDTLFFIECKAGYLNINDITNSTSSDLIKSILKKFGGQYVDEAQYKSLPSNERKGTIQIMHNYFKLNEAIKNKNFSIYDDPEGLKTELDNIRKVYGIVLIEEPYLSSIGLNTLLYRYNLPAVQKFTEKHFYPPIYVHVNDLYKIIYNEDLIKGRKLTFEKAIKNYLTTLHDNEMPSKFYSFNDYLMNIWHTPIEFGEEDNTKLIKKTMNELYESVGLEPPNKPI